MTLPGKQEFEHRHQAVAEVVRRDGRSLKHQTRAVRNVGNVGNVRDVRELRPLLAA